MHLGSHYILGNKKVEKIQRDRHIEAFVDVVDDLFLFQHVCRPHVLD